MLEAFIAAFSIAVIFTCYSFMIIEEDAKRKSERVIYILLIAIAAWPVSLSLMQAPSWASSTTTTAYSSYNVIESNVPLYCTLASATCGTTTELIQYPAHNTTTTQTVETNSPFPTWAFYSYMPLSLGITLLLVVFLIKYMLEYSAKTAIEGLSDLTK